jgi:hypothetical protein
VTVAYFDGGSFLLQGVVLNEQKYIDFGFALVNGCHDTYVSTLTGIGPEVFQWVTNTVTLPLQTIPPIHLLICRESRNVHQLSVSCMGVLFNKTFD